MANKTSGDDRRSTDQVKAEFLDGLRKGNSIAETLLIVGRGRSWYEDHRKRDAAFKAEIIRIQGLVKDAKNGPSRVPEFPEFCEQYLGMRLWDHQLNLYDVLEGRQPRWMDPSMSFTRGSMEDKRIIINIPPGHAKTMTVSISYVLWRILSDPDMSVLVISRTQDFAKKILWAIKQRLTHPRYANLQLAFGPPGGFKESAEQWSATRLYLWGDQRTGQEKDPTIEAVGLGGTIYGNRARLILVDDAITLTNASAWSDQQDWLRQDVASRIGPDDQIVVVGTRVAPIDLYRELQNPEHYADDEVPWTVFTMPAILEYGPTPAEHRTLWPISDQPFSDADKPGEDGLYQRWTGQRLAKVRNEVGPRRWNLVYQQLDVDIESVFDAACVNGSIERTRHVGPIMPGVTPGVPADARPHIIVGIDPAVAGTTAMSVLAVDRRSGRRWLLDMLTKRGPTPKQMREMIEDIVARYSPNEIIVEANAYQLALVQDETITRFLAARGIPMKPHYTTTKNKKDEQFGVASMSVLFGTTAAEGPNGRATHQGDNLLSLPHTGAAGVKQLVDELVAWSPEIAVKNLRQDCLMALWFAELRAREIVVTAKRQAFQQGNRYLSARDRSRRYTVNLTDAAAMRDAGDDIYV